jgi:hypothetical protein
MASAISATGLTVGFVPKRVYAGVVPDVRSVAAVSTKLDVVGVTSGSNLEDQNELVL